MHRRALPLLALLASVGGAGCGWSSSIAHPATPAPSAPPVTRPPALAAFFASPDGAEFAALFGPGAGIHDCRFVPGGPVGQPAMRGSCRTSLADNDDGTGIVTLDQAWTGGRHRWVFRLATTGVSAVQSTGDVPPQLWR